MSIIMGIATEGVGAWLAADGRFCDGERVITDRAVRARLLGPGAGVAITGNPELMPIIESEFIHGQGPRAWLRDVRSAAFESRLMGLWDMLVYQHGWLWSCVLAVSSIEDHGVEVHRVPIDTMRVLGDGADFAYGALYALGTGRGMSAVLHCCISAAGARHVQCGGEVTIVRVPEEGE